MPSRPPVLAALVVAALAAGCANRAEQATREAWNAALRSDGGGGDQADGGHGGGDQADDEDERAAWAAVGDALERISETLASGVSTVNFPRLAERLCGRPVEGSDEGDRDVFHCEPEPGLEVLGESLEVELDTSGVVAYVAPDITDEESEALLQQALLRLATRCAQTWTAVPADAENAHEEFHSCPLANGPVIAVGRFPRDLAANQWQFSLVVLGPG
ncbi:MAG: hypothetical protein R3A79_01350 [Nannocystaceae bacterium]